MIRILIKPVYSPPFKESVPCKYTYLTPKHAFYPTPRQQAEYF